MAQVGEKPPAKVVQVDVGLGRGAGPQTHRGAQGGPTRKAGCGCRAGGLTGISTLCKRHAE